MAKSRLMTDAAAKKLAFQAEQRCYKRYDGDYDGEHRRSCIVAVGHHERDLLYTLKRGDRKGAKNAARRLLRAGGGTGYGRRY